MAWLDKKVIRSSDGKILATILGETLLTMDEVSAWYTNEGFRDAVNYPICGDIHKVILLYDDETERFDMSSYVIDGTLSYSHEYKSGQSRSVSMTILNHDDEWKPDPVSGRIWSGSKIKLYDGILYDGTLYWIAKGIFIMRNPSYDDDAETASLQFSDKFAALDGTLGGTLENDYKISVNTPIYSAVTSLLALDSGNGRVFDTKSVIFPSSYASVKTPYTLEVDSNSSIGDMILTMAEMISCDVFYDDDGHLTLEPSEELLDVANKPILWTFNDSLTECPKPTYDVDFEGVVNKVCVIGANINGAICKHTAINTNPKSPSNIYMTPISFSLITDSNISTYALCKVRAEYELQKASVVSMTYKFECVHMPFVRAGAVIVYNSAAKNVFGVKMFVSEVSDSGGKTTITCSNIEDMPF